MKNRGSAALTCRKAQPFRPSDQTEKNREVVVLGCFPESREAFRTASDGAALGGHEQAKRPSAAAGSRGAVSPIVATFRKLQ